MAKKTKKNEKKYIYISGSAVDDIHILHVVQNRR